MLNRNLVWTLATLAIALVVIPIIGALVMMVTGATCCAGMMGGTPVTMAGMSALGVIWMLAAAAVVILLIVVLSRAVTRT